MSFPRKRNISESKVKRATIKNETFLATLPQNGFNPDVARFATHVKSVLQLRLFTGLSEGVKTRNIAFFAKQVARC